MVMVMVMTGQSRVCWWGVAVVVVVVVVAAWKTFDSGSTTLEGCCWP
jgi:hypothetical protein